VKPVVNMFLWQPLSEEVHHDLTAERNEIQLQLSRLIAAVERTRQYPATGHRQAMESMARPVGLPNHGVLYTII